MGADGSVRRLRGDSDGFTFVKVDWNAANRLTQRRDYIPKLSKTKTKPKIKPCANLQRDPVSDQLLAVHPLSQRAQDAGSAGPKRRSEKFGPIILPVIGPVGQRFSRPIFLNVWNISEAFRPVPPPVATAADSPAVRGDVLQRIFHVSIHPLCMWHMVVSPRSGHSKQITMPSDLAETVVNSSVVSVCALPV